MSNTGKSKYRSLITLLRIEQLNTRKIIFFLVSDDTGIRVIGDWRGKKEDKRTPVIYDKSWLYICIYVWMHIYIQIYIHTRICEHVLINMYM